MADPKPDVDQMSFEEAFEELETIVDELERGDIPLEQALRAFERGQKLAARGQELLDQAELKLTELASEPDRDPDGMDQEA